MGNCCNNNLQDESHYSISMEKVGSSVDLLSPPVINTISSSDSLVISNISEKRIQEVLVSEKDTCPGIKEEASITNQTPEEGFYKCICGSFYIWKTDIVFWHYEKFGDWNIRCDFCMNYFSKSAWKCKHCGKIMCRDCGVNEGMQACIESCVNSHELLWTPNFHSYNKSGYICGLCKKYRKEPSWSCKGCEYYMCFHCGIQKGLKPNSNLLVCKEKKPLFHYKRSEIAFVCNKCNEVSNKNSFSCSSCDYSVCTLCSESILASMVAHPGFKCRKNHDLSVMKNEGTMENKGKMCSCLKCDNVCDEYGYLCGECFEGYCFKCGDEVIKAIEDYSGIKCGKGHYLFWNPSLKNDSGNLCMVCWKRTLCGCFRCEDCGINVCVDDISRIN